MCILKSRTVVGATPPLPAQIAIPTIVRRKSIGRSLPEPLCWDEGTIISKLRQSIRWWHSYSSAKGSARCPGFVGPKWLRFEQRCSPETRDGWIGKCRWLFCFFVSGVDFWCNLHYFVGRGRSRAPGPSRDAEGMRVHRSTSRKDSLKSRLSQNGYGTLTGFKSGSVRCYRTFRSANHSFLENVWFLFALVPQASQRP